MYADLHIHSWYSDGALSPEEIVEKAKEQNISLISVCDHEMVDVYLNHGVDFGSEDVRIIPGVELIALMDDKEYHICAYRFDMQDKALRDLMKYNRGILLDKGSKLIEKMLPDYPGISMQEFLKYERDRKNGGWESIDYLKSKNIIGSVSEYLDLARKYPVELDDDFLQAEEVIKIIHDAGGYAVLAHPGPLGDDAGNLEECKRRANRFLNAGIDGFECYYPMHTGEITDFFVEFCRGHDLMITAGSDEHGGFNGEEYYIGAVKVEIDKLNLKDMIK